MTTTILLALGVLAGAGQVKITPPAGTPMAGYYYARAATGVHDDLWAKSLYLEVDGQRAALVSCDVIKMPDAVASEAKRLITARTGLAARQVMISGTHAHTGPVVSAEYARVLPAWIAESVARAQAAARPARLRSGVGHEPSLVFNRRFYLTDGTVGWNPGKRNPKIVRPAGPVDPEAPVLLVESADGTPILTYVNYALHLDTAGGTELSADYPYTLGRLLAAAKGAGMMTMFTIGCAGNVNHLNVSDATPQKGHGEAARIGAVLAGEVLKTYARMTPVDVSALRAATETLALPLAPYTAEELALASEAGQKSPFLDQVKARRVLDVAARAGKPLDAEVQVISIGRDVAIVGLPGEIFVEHGLAIKHASPFRHTIVVSLANGDINYIPNRQAYREGNYEVISARTVEGSGERLVETAIRMLKETHSWR
jgi:hypothetical protein